MIWGTETDQAAEQLKPTLLKTSTLNPLHIGGILCGPTLKINQSISKNLHVRVVCNKKFQNEGGGLPVK